MKTWNERLAYAIENSHHTRASFAAAIGVSAPTVTDWCTGEIKNLRAENAENACVELEINSQWLLKGKGEMRSASKLRMQTDIQESSAKYSPPHIVIPQLDVFGSMGAGLPAPTGHVDIVDRMSVNAEYLRRTVSFSKVSNLALITGYGDSMETTFRDGDTLLVDTGVNEIKVDAVYVLSWADELYIKRIQRRPDGCLLMLSDNQKYPPYEIRNGEADNFQVLARVLLVWNIRRL